jgi:hypothetical protein
MVAACFMKKCHSSAVMVLSHFEIAWFGIDRAAAHIIPFDLLTSPFCHWIFCVIFVGSPAE